MNRVDILAVILLGGLFLVLATGCKPGEYAQCGIPVSHPCSENDKYAPVQYPTQPSPCDQECFDRRMRSRDFYSILGGVL